MYNRNSVIIDGLETYVAEISSLGTVTRNYLDFRVGNRGKQTNLRRKPFGRGSTWNDVVKGRESFFFFPLLSLSKKIGYSFDEN